MPIRAVVYVSEAGSGSVGGGSVLDASKLDWLVSDAARFNRDAGVTGILLFDGYRFLQYLEGPDDGLEVAYSRVQGATSHHDLVELHRGSVGRRRLPFWPMRWLPVGSPDMSSIARGNWSGFHQRGPIETPNSTAMDRLQHFVQQHVHPA